MIAPPDLVLAFDPAPPPPSALPPALARRHPPADPAPRQAAREYAVLLDRLRAHGLLVTARRATDRADARVWVLVRAPQTLVDELNVRERSDDFLHGVTTSPTAPGAETDPATRLRLVHDLVTGAIEQGGIAITPNAYPWAHVTAIFALHDHETDAQWIKQWTTRDWKVGLSLEHTDTAFLLRHHGPALALYFSFLSTYTLSLVPLAALSVLAYLFLPPYSLLYALPTSLWALAFVEYWRARERVLDVDLGTDGIERVQRLRADASPGADAEPWWRRSARVAAGVPVLFACALFLAAVLTLLFVGEAFVAKLYTGPGQAYIGFVPTACFSLIVPRILALYKRISAALTAFEDHPSRGAHADALTRKTFALQSVVAYAGLALSAFAYVPFGPRIMAAVDGRVFGRAAAEGGGPVGAGRAVEGQAGQAVVRGGGGGAPAKHHAINKGRLQDQLFAYTVTNQAVNALTELALPIALRQLAAWRGRRSTPTPTPTAGAQAKASEVVQLGRAIGESDGLDAGEGEGEKEVVSEEERDLLARIEKEAALPPYDLFTDYAEMVTQFGYVALWSICWPLAAFSSLVNNYFELRGDALKIVHNVQRPIPARVASLGPWLDALTVLASLSAVTATTLHLLFHPHDLRFRFLPAGAERFLTPAYDAAAADAAAGGGVAETLFPLVLVGLASAQAAELVRRGLAYGARKVVWEGSAPYRAARDKGLALRRRHLEQARERAGGLGRGGAATTEDAGPFWTADGVSAVEVGRAFKTE